MGKKYKKTKRYSKTKRYIKTKRYRKRKYNHKKEKNMKGGNIETIGSVALAGASAPLILGTTAMGTAGLAAAAAAGNVVKQASKNHLCECSGNHYGQPCTGCKKPSSLTPFCPAIQNCCRGRFQNMFGQEPLINTHWNGLEEEDHFVCKECLRSEKDIMIQKFVEYQVLSDHPEQINPEHLRDYDNIMQLFERPGVYHLDPDEMYHIGRELLALGRLHQPIQWRVPLWREARVPVTIPRPPPPQPPPPWPPLPLPITPAQVAEVNSRDDRAAPAAGGG